MNRQKFSMLLNNINKMLLNNFTKYVILYKKINKLNVTAVRYNTVDPAYMHILKIFTI